jgi:hypothetical protein
MFLPHPRHDKNKAKGCHLSCGSHQKKKKKTSPKS